MVHSRKSVTDLYSQASLAPSKFNTKSFLAESFSSNALVFGKSEDIEPLDCCVFCFILS